MEMEHRQGELKDAQDTIRRLEDQLRETKVCYPHIFKTIRILTAASHRSRMLKIQSAGRNIDSRGKKLSFPHIVENLSIYISI